MSEWRTVPLRAIYQRSELRGRADLPLLSVYRDHGVVPRDERDDNHNRPSDDLSTYKYVRPGDLVVNKMKTWQGSLAVSHHEGIVSPAYFVGRRVAAVDNRFMHHLLRSLPLIAEYGARSKGIRPSQWDLPWDEFAAIKVSLPTAGKQQAIADYLDTETARIDALIAKKQELVNLVALRLRLAVDATLGCSVAEGLAASTDQAWVPVRYIAAVRGGLTLGKRYEGRTVPVPYLRVLNVQDGFLDLADVAELEVPPEAVARYSLDPGDLLLLEGNGNPENLGRGTIWRGELPTCLHQNHVHVVRPDRARIHPDYLDRVIRTSWARHFFTGGSDVVGISTLSQDRVRSLRIPCPSLDEQTRLVARVTAEHSTAEQLRKHLDLQIGLLREHRQALITAAVTGELEVPVGAA